MATNKIIELLKMQESYRKTGVQNLINGGVDDVNIDSTIPTIINRMPELSYSVSPPPPRWEQDPLIKWNGENIDDMWENDPRKNDWLYRMIVVINGVLDTQNFKANTTTVAQRNALAFETSDGAWYEPSTSTTLEHTWNKDYDIYDSNGIPVRYIKVYSNIEIDLHQTPQFNNNCRYVIYDIIKQAQYQSISNIGFFQSCPYLERFSGNSIININARSINFLSLSRSLKKVELNNLEEITTNVTSSILSNIEHIVYIDIPKLKRVASIGGASYRLSFLNNLSSIYSVSMQELEEIVNCSILYNDTSELHTLITPRLKILQDTNFLSTTRNLTVLDIQNIEEIKNSLFLSASSLKNKTLNLQSLKHINTSGTIYNITGIETIDLSSLETLISTGSQYIFYGMSSLKSFIAPNLSSFELGSSIYIINYNPLLEIIDIGVAPSTTSRLFYLTNNTSLKKLIIRNKNTYGIESAIYATNTPNLTSIVIPNGWESNISIPNSNLMTREALMNVIDNMADMTGQTAIVFNMGAINLGKLTDDDKAVAVSKNITLS